MNKEFLKEQFNLARENKNGICVELEMPGQNTTEKIINDYDALDIKLEYYEKTYDEKLVHKNNSEIKIIKVYPCDWYTGE